MRKPRAPVPTYARACAHSPGPCAACLVCTVCATCDEADGLLETVNPPPGGIPVTDPVYLTDTYLLQLEQCKVLEAKSEPSPEQDTRLP